MNAREREVMDYALIVPEIEAAAARSDADYNIIREAAEGIGKMSAEITRLRALIADTRAGERVEAVKLNAWLSALLKDDCICERMKDDIRAWQAADQPAQGGQGQQEPVAWYPIGVPAEKANVITHQPCAEDADNWEPLFRSAQSQTPPKEQGQHVIGLGFTQDKLDSAVHRLRNKLANDDAGWKDLCVVMTAIESAQSQTPPKRTGRAMKVSELIAAIGDDNVRLQNLDQCATDFKLTKAGVKVTFATDVGFDLNGSTMLGLVIWLDREAAKSAMAKEQS